MISIPNQFLLLIFALYAGCGCRMPAPNRTVPTRNYKLVSEASWTLQPPAGRFDASGLVRLPSGQLLTVNDKDPGVFEIRFGTNQSNANLLPWPQLSPAHFSPLNTGRDLPWDLEGIAIGPDKALYLCEEHSRWILRQRKTNGPLERLPIDWSSESRWFRPTDRNASWEGIAVGGGRLWVANERSIGRIFEIDLKTLAIIGSFRVAPPSSTAEDIHYTDLCWYEGQLWVLCRENRRVLCVDPDTRQVLSSFSYFEVEMDPRYAYRHILPYGFFEGLSVDADFIWLLIDNNGYGRKSDSKDTRPQLFRCPRPDKIKGNNQSLNLLAARPK